LRIEKHYLEGYYYYKLSFPNYDANSKQIKLTQQITSSGKIQVQTTEANPVKILDDQGNIQITHHSDQVSSEIKEVEHEGFVEDANFTYHASGQLIISNLPAGITIEHYVKPPIQNILNGLEEAFIVLKSGDKITFLADDNLAKLTIRIL
jgi:ribosomal 50S subunit-recycling heat shock protein